MQRQLFLQALQSQHLQELHPLLLQFEVQQLVALQLGLLNRLLVGGFRS